MRSWVPHIMVYIVPQQMLELGDPARRSCDACESFGAMCKKVIKHLTCRRSLTARFTKGWVQTCFSRVTVREGLAHGEANTPWLQRADFDRLGTRVARREVFPTPEKPTPPTVTEALAAATVLLEVAV